MVEDIGLGIPPGMEVDNPTKDAAFMARIGAEKISAFDKKENCIAYELTNFVTGTRFAFQWFPQVSLFT